LWINFNTCNWSLLAELELSCLTINSLPIFGAIIFPNFHMNCVVKKCTNSYLLDIIYFILSTMSKCTLYIYLQK
jgi:hypothetical protein